MATSRRAEEATSQDWRVLVPEKKQMENIKPRWPFECGYAFTNKSASWDAWAKLAHPALLDYSKQKMRRPSVPENPRAFDRLPDEIIDMIVEELFGSKMDVLALGLTSSRLWELVVYGIRCSLLKLAAPWAGYKLVLQGAASTDVTPSIDRELVKDVLGDMRWTNTWLESTDAQEFYEKHQKYDRNLDVISERKSWISAMALHIRQGHVLYSCLTMIRQLKESTNFFPRDRTWVLRNLTTHEFVFWMDRTLPTDHTEETRGEALAALDFVLFMRICWSNTPNDVGLNTCRGKWAGHRFDIVTDEVFEAERGNNSWEDVTTEVNDEVWDLRSKQKEYWIRQRESYSGPSTHGRRLSFHRILGAAKRALS